MRLLAFDWLGSSLSSEPGGLTGLSVASHAGVLARSKISGSLLHRLSQPWTAWGQEAPTVINVQRYGAAPKFSSLLRAIDPPHAQQSLPQHPPLPILVAAS